MNEPLQVMVASRNPTIRESISASFGQPSSGMHFIDTPELALRRYGTQTPDLLVLDIESEAGLHSIERFRAMDSRVPIVAVTTVGRVARIVQALRLGAFDVASTPFTTETFSASLRAAQQQHAQARQMAALQHEVQSQSKHTMLFGTGDAMADVRTLIAQIIDTDVPVLIHGESGTGKELVARAIAAPSRLRGRPFVKVNCAALPTEMLEAELFGFERGAFTGASQDKPGKFEIAMGGTIFLDEIGELPIGLQSKLLQVLQDGHFSRLGGGEVHADVRVIAATNRDLDRAVIDGHFREDLLFRLNVIPVSLPPLRERRADIPSLARFFLKRWTVLYNRQYLAISPKFMDELVRYSWPGNIRELENLIKRTVVLGSETSARTTVTRMPPPPAFISRNAIAASPVLRELAEPASRTADAIPTNAPVIGGGEDCSIKAVARRAAQQVEVVMIERMLKQTGGSMKQTAINLQISYKALIYKCKEHSLSASVWRRRS
jgi:DNA-binding NtrC family response regulator